MQSIVRSMLFGLVLGATAAPGWAQSGAPATSKGISITPYIGVLIPTADLLDFNSQVTKLSAGIVFGGRLGIGLGSRFGIEGDVGYSPASFEYSSGTATLNQDVSILTGSGRATLYLIPRTSPVWLGVSGGVGAVRHTFKAGTSGAASIEAGTNVGGVIGASAGIRVGRVVALNIGVEDYLYNASFDVNGTLTSEQKQHDIRVTIGIRFPFLGF
jgi:hypothetical protein